MSGGYKVSTVMSWLLYIHPTVFMSVPACLFVSVSDDKEIFDGELQSDDGKYSFQLDAVNSRWDGRIKPRTRAALDDEELFAVVDWGNTSAILVVVGAVLVTTVVAAVLALVLHTRRRLVTDGRITAGSGRNATMLNNKRDRLKNRNGGGNEVKNVLFFYN